MKGPVTALHGGADLSILLAHSFKLNHIMFEVIVTSAFHNPGSTWPFTDQCFLEEGSKWAALLTSWKCLWRTFHLWNVQNLVATCHAVMGQTFCVTGWQSGTDTN